MQQQGGGKTLKKIHEELEDERWNMLEDIELIVKAGKYITDKKSHTMILSSSELHGGER
jgi:hypothetical protein